MYIWIFSRVQANQQNYLIMRLAFIAIFLVSFLTSCHKKVADHSRSQPISHTLFDQVLQKYVDTLGNVDYAGLAKDRSTFDSYIQLLSNNHPNTKNWSGKERLAYWINAYNAYTIQLILDHYPVAGIKEIKNGIPFVNSVWDIKFINLGGEKFDLNNIEHGILRKEFADPRIHFALVCASMSCPKLQQFAFTAEQLDEQLDQAAREFFNAPYRNNITGNPIGLSKILSWYWTDFKDTYVDRYALLEQYAETEIDRDAKIDFLDYDWSLNEQTAEKVALLKGEWGAVFLTTKTPEVFWIIFSLR